MLLAKYPPNRRRGRLNIFTIYGHSGHLEFRINTILTIFRSPYPGRYI